MTRLRISLIVAVWLLLGDRLPAQLIDQPLVIRRSTAPVNNMIGRRVTVPGASLKTDPELESILEKAQRFCDEKQYSIACRLWQSVLDRSGDSLFTEDDEIYYSLARVVERVLAALPPEEGLADYRVTADASAKEIMALAESPFDERALTQVVRRFFLSSLGDDAALTLSRIYMDNHDFVGALRLLGKIESIYPDPTVSMIDVHSSKALCLAMMGDAEEAEQSLKSARQLLSGKRDRTLDQLQAVIESGDIGDSVSDSAALWLAPLGNRNRNGLMPALPAGTLENDLEAVWHYHFPLSATRWADVKETKPIFGPKTLSMISDSMSSNEDRTYQRWRQFGWRPTGDLLFDGSKVYFKTSIDMAVWNNNVEANEVVWRPLWRNDFRLDDYTQSVLEFRRRLRRGRNSTQPNSAVPEQVNEIQLFGDRVATQFTIQDGVLYTIEGVRFDSMPKTVRRRQNSRYNFYSRRSRTNRLTAYDARTGKIRWTLPPLDAESDSEANEMRDDEPESPWLQAGGFMAAPIAYAGLIIVPVNHGGAIFVYALDPQRSGKTVWKSFLCDESESGANPWSPVNLSIDGSDLFASCGLGVVFVLDPSTGLIRFARRYPREGRIGPTASRFGRGVQMIDFDSWTSDTVVAHRSQMISFASDASRIEAFDRNSGRLKWFSEPKPLSEPVDYLIGVHNGILYAGGKRTILAWDLDDEGRLIWGGRSLFEDEVSCGRAMLTRDGIYVPVGDSICRYSLEGKSGRAEMLDRVSVELGSGAPVGNLFSDGRRIWVLGANRIYALGAVR